MEQITPEQLRAIIAATQPSTAGSSMWSPVDRLANAGLLVLRLFAEACLKEAETRK